MKWRRTQLLLVWLAALFAGVAVHAHETDQYTLPEGREFADIGRHLNEWAYGAIERGVEKTNRRIAQYLEQYRGPSTLEQLQSADEIARAVNREFGNAYDVIEGLEKRLHSAEMQRQFPGKVVGYKQQFGNIFQNVHFPLDPRQFFRIWHATTFMAYGTYFGTDKVGHFTDMGMNYYRPYSAARQRGLSEEEAVAEALNVGINNPIIGERGMVGFLSAGHYSNADLAANYLGFVFYRNLTEEMMVEGEMKKPMLQRDGDFWTIAPHVRADSDFFAMYISDHLDEALNPGLFESAMRGAVQKAVKERTSLVLNRRADRHGNRRPRAYFDARYEELRTYYGQDYGHAGTYEQVVTIGNTCFDPFPEHAQPSDRNEVGWTPLHEAAALGDLARVKRLIALGGDVNAQVRSQEDYSPEWGNTPLHYAARDGRLEVVEFLLSRGADAGAANDRGVTPLHRALAYRDIVQTLLRRGGSANAADVRGRTPLHWAAEDGQTEAIDALLAAKANVRVRDRSGQTPLHAAARTGQANVAVRLIAHGADFNAKTSLGQTPLHFAAARNHAAFADALLSYGAAANAGDQFGWTPLHDAASRGLTEMVSLLIEHGASASALNAHRNTPLHLAARNQHDTVVALLVASGADVHRQNESGMTALHEAAMAGNRQIVAMLLQHGARAATPNADGRTPEQIASDREIIAMLRDGTMLNGSRTQVSDEGARR